MRPGNHAKGQFTAAHACPRLPCHSRDCKDAAASARAQLRVMRTCLGCSRTTPRLPTGSVLSVWPGARRSSSRSRSRWTACSSRRTPTRQSRAWPARAWRATPRSGPRSCSWSRASRPCRARRRARRARRARAARGSRPARSTLGQPGPPGQPRGLRRDTGRGAFRARRHRGIRCLHTPAHRLAVRAGSSAC